VKIAPVALVALLASCAHPEDRRWASLDTSGAIGAAKPTVQLYSFATPPDGRPATRLRDLSGEGQAAYIAAVTKTDDATGLRQRLATPIASASGLDATVPAVLNRTLVVTVRKADTAGIGDRLMRTIVTIRPVDDAFRFAGYTIAATDTQVQDIAHLETKTEGSLEVALAPPIKGFGDNSVTGKVSQSHSTAADIIQQYEKLNVDIQPREMVITRESERGLDDHQAFDRASIDNQALHCDRTDAVRQERSAKAQQGFVGA
jgi:hypothetical protein